MTNKEKWEELIDDLLLHNLLPIEYAEQLRRSITTAISEARREAIGQTLEIMHRLRFEENKKIIDMAIYELLKLTPSPSQGGDEEKK